MKGLQEDMPTKSAGQEVMFDIEKTIVISGLSFDRFETDDILKQKVISVFEAMKENPPPGGNDPALAGASPLRLMRMRPRAGDGGRCPIVKCEFSSKDEKIAVLRGKANLQHSREYRRVFLRTSKSREARLIEDNFKAIIAHVGADKVL